MSDDHDEEACVVSTLAGSREPAYADGLGPMASFRGPLGIACDGDGALLVVDSDNRRVRKIKGGHVTTIAGTGALGCTDGMMSTFNDPTGICLDASGNIYICDAGSHTIRRINSNGAVVTIAGNGRPGHADGVGASAAFSYPFGIAAAPDGTLLVADSCNHCIRRVTADGMVTTLAGRGVQGSTDGNGTRAAFNYPVGVAVDAAGMAYVADRSNHRIRTVDKFGAVRTLAGTGISGYSDGPGLKSTFEWPHSVTVDSQGNVYVSDTFTFQVRRIGKDGIVKRVCRGSDNVGSRQGDRQTASGLKCICMDSKRDDVMYVTDQANHCVQKINFLQTTKEQLAQQAQAQAQQQAQAQAPQSTPQPQQPAQAPPAAP